MTDVCFRSVIFFSPSEKDKELMLIYESKKSLNLAPSMAPSAQKDIVLKIIAEKTDTEVHQMITANPVAHI